MHMLLGMLKNFPQNMIIIQIPAITTMILDDYLTQLDMKVDAKNKKSQFLRNIEVVFFQLTVPPSYSF